MRRTYDALDVRSKGRSGWCLPPNVIARDGRAGVQTGELLLVTDQGLKRPHAYPPGLHPVG